MSVNLLDSVRGLLSNDVIANASSALGESESNMQKATSGIVPSVLAGIMNKAGSGDAGSMLRMSKETFNSGMLSNIGDFFGNNNLINRGTDMLRSIFGDRTNNVANMIAGYSGIKPGSATMLMSAAAPAALGALGRHASSTNMDESDFVSFLDSQKDAVMNAVPTGLNLAGALGLSSLGSIGSKLTGAFSGIGGTVRDMSANVRKTRTGARWLVPVIIALAVIALLWAFLGRRTDRNKNMQVASDVNRDSMSASARPDSRSIKVQLPNGQEIDAHRGGIEDRLVSFLNDPSKKADKNTWFDFDRLNFERGSAVITQESKTQLQNIAAIMKAFPNTAIKIGGYTDKTGNEAINRNLSQERADAVLAALKDNGVNENQLAGAEGYGSQFAEAAEDATDEERRKDRRIAVSVRKK